MSPLGHLKKYFKHTVSLKWNSESPTCFSSTILISVNGLTFHLLMETRNQEVICLSLKSFCSSPNMPRAPTHFQLISDSCSFYLLNLSHICQRLPLSWLITLVRATSPLSSDSSTYFHFCSLSVCPPHCSHNGYFKKRTCSKPFYSAGE